ncbi:hypothetical protein [Flavobacterium sp. NRK F7]|uniref:hypothetical protein n=1 Tax=Flavobacterium sp. NRK F7 TaxID=2954930 RepID=UPI00209015C5|nr:hypothetical protein [Flavobacterium sp. NRK F7]MCO6163851.1 hypothetical protein [Flavobacterium sp. NRK F7]
MKLAVKIILGLSATAALGMVIGVIPNPFETPTDVPLHLQHEMKVVWNYDGKQQSIPTIEQGTPFDDSKYFDLKAKIAINPIEPHGFFKFDYEMEQYIAINNQSGNFTYKVNSNDNSMYIHGTDIENNDLFQPLKNNPYVQQYKINFIIRNAQNDWYAFVEHQEKGKICIKMPSGFTFSNVFTDTYSKSLEVLNSAKANANTITNTSPLEPYRGTFTDNDGSQKRITFWFAKEEAQIPTGIPLMGFGVGVFKDVLEKKQKFLAVTEAEDGVSKLLHLEQIEEWGINTDGYKILSFDFHLPTGKAKTENMVSWLKTKQDEIAQLRAARKNCPSHQAGSDCRKNYEKRIKEVQDEIASRAQELATQMMPPMK